MENRIDLLSSLRDLSYDVGQFYIKKASEETVEEKKNLYTFITYVFLSISPMTDLTLQGAKEENNLMIFSGLRMIEENFANLSYIFHDSSKTNDYISKILTRGTEYQEAFTELRDDPSRGLMHLDSVGRWTRSTITQRVRQLGEGPAFRYELSCKYLHADIWAILNNQAIKDMKGYRFGLVSWGIEDINMMLWVLRKQEMIPNDLLVLHEKLIERVVDELKKEPGPTYA